MPVVLVSALVVVLAAVAVVLLLGGGKKTGGSGSQAAATRAHAVRRWPGPATKGSSWLDGSGAPLLSAVTVDLGKVTSAEQAGNRSMAESAGAGLASAARAALAGPMPQVDAKVYRSALKKLEKAGSYVASGQFGDAASLLRKGEAGLLKVTAAADAPVPVKTPAIPEPND